MPASIAPAREAAFEILSKIAAQSGNSDLLLQSPRVAALSPADRKLCTALVLGTLRWQTALDSECRRFLARPQLALADETRLALRVGAYQLLFLDRIPVHAAIFESVEWLKRFPGARQAGMVNAVLRKVATAGKARSFAAESAYPAWMTARWRQQYGADACRRICEQGQQEPRAALRLLRPQAESELRALEIELEPGKLVTQARYPVERAPQFAEYLPTAGAQMQDEGSQLVAELLGRGERILDCCAAPGGKTAALIQNSPEARVLACDASGKRLVAMRERLERAGLAAQVEFRVADAARLAGVGEFDRILCDAPCSGTGTLARNPEIRHRLQPEDLARQAERQRAILGGAMRLLAAGGRLLYATCSLEPEENEAVVEACLQAASAANARFVRIDLRGEFERLVDEQRARGAGVEALRQTGFRDGYLRTLPGIHPCDGFFAAMIERQSISAA